MSDDRLIRLPGGTWVRPSAVVLIKAEDGSDRYSVPPQVTIVLAKGSFEIIPADSLDAARELCDRIGRTIADAEDEEEDTDDGRE